MWTLILLTYAGIWSKGDSVALTNVSGFKTEAACIVAGKHADVLVKETKKEVRFICVKQE